jgi:hypothetical protein
MISVYKDQGTGTKEPRRVVAAFGDASPAARLSHDHRFAVACALLALMKESAREAN